MAEEKWKPSPYTDQELLSFDRLRRAVMNRVIDKMESLMTGEFPVSPEQAGELIDDEWKRAKEAVYSSPAAREAYRKHLESIIVDRLDKLIQADKDDLAQWGVAEKSI